MSDASTKKMIRMYNERARPAMFLSSLFQSPAENFFRTEAVELDIVRSGEPIAIALQSMDSGYRYNSTDRYTNKSFVPPIFKEAFPVNASDLMKRVPGNDPFQSPNFRANIVRLMFNGMLRVEDKIHRSNELQAAQVLTTGQVDLKSESGATIYSIDYKPKATHFPTASTAWDAGGATILEDIESLCEVIRNDGLVDPDQVIMSAENFEVALKDTKFIARFDSRRANLGAIVPMQGGTRGANYRGTIEIGSYKLDLYTYGARYTDPQTGNATKYIPADKVVVRASQGRLDAAFGAIPNIGQELGVRQNNILPELPRRLRNSSGRMDLFTNMWLSEDGETLHGGVGARPIYIPTAIDTYGCLDTGI